MRGTEEEGVKMIARDARHCLVVMDRGVCVEVYDLGNATLEGEELGKLAEIANLRGLDLMLVEMEDTKRYLDISDGLRRWPVRNTKKK